LDGEDLEFVPTETRDYCGIIEMLTFNGRARKTG